MSMMQYSKSLTPAREFVRHSGLFSSAAQVMGDMVLRTAGCENTALYWAMVLVCQSALEQHVCCKLEEYAGKTLCSLNDADLSIQLPDMEEFSASWDIPEVRSVTALAALDDAGKIRRSLLVVDQDNCCYLQRQWSFESSIARELKLRAEKSAELPLLRPGKINGLMKYFKNITQHPAVDYQQLAVAASLQNRLLVVSGGPGTGKTTVATAILAIKLEQNTHLTIKMAAPTAKAAMRLQESIAGNLDKLNSSDAVKKQIAALECTTVHSLLGSRHNSHEFKHNADEPLHCDLLLVDECSMVSQDLMARLLEALPEHADLILLGDRYQLASVDAGAVMADICDVAYPNAVDKKCAELFASQTSWQPLEISALGRQYRKLPLNGCLIELEENHRFATSSPLLGEISGMIRDLNHSGDAEKVAGVIVKLKGDEFEFKAAETLDLTRFLYKKLSQPRLESGECLLDLPRLANSGNEEDLRKAFLLLNKFKLLAVAYKGSCGIEKLNEICMQILKLKTLHDPGMAILIKRNDYRLGLVNGDIGISCRCPDGKVKVFFAGIAHGFDPADLPEHEAVFAMSVHKSQGSGFAEVVFVMPENDCGLLTREMVYTAMTRAEEKLCCIGSEKLLAAALGKVTHRVSNLVRRMCEQ